MIDAKYCYSVNATCPWVQKAHPGGHMVLPTKTYKNSGFLAKLVILVLYVTLSIV